MLAIFLLGILVVAVLAVIWVVHVVVTVVGIILALMVVALMLAPFIAILAAHIDLREDGEAGRVADVVLAIVGTAFIAVDVVWILHGLNFSGGPKWWYFWTTIASAGLFTAVRSGVNNSALKDGA